MSRRPLVRLLPDGLRLHLQDGPIDLVIGADGASTARAEAFRQAVIALTGLLDELCDELPLLRAPARAGVRRFAGPVARRMEAAVMPFAADAFITPMAAVAGAVAEAVLDAMVAAVDLDRAFVNNGGDIALRCSGGPPFRIGMVDRPDHPGLFGQVAIGPDDGIRGVATSGWRGRSFSLGIADSVTVLARAAAEADAAATVVANAVDLPGHPAIQRCSARHIQADSDLGERLVTRDVARLDQAEIARALAGGIACAEGLLARGLLIGAALQVQGTVVIVGAVPMSRRAEILPGIFPRLPKPEVTCHA